MKNLFTLSILCILSFTFTSCDALFKTEKKRVIVLLDLSSSIEEKVYLEYYEKIDFIVSNLGMNDAISVYPIDGGSITSFQPIMESDFQQDKKQFDIKGLNKAQSDKLKKEAFVKYCQKLVADIQAKVNTVDRSSYSSNTDIIGALQNASKDIEDKKDIYQSQSILILSDMMQYADNGLKMCATESIENWMSKLPKCKAVQKGMPVAIVTGSQANMNTEMYSKIQNFWTQFFQIQGAELICYNSAQNTSLDKLFKIE